MKRLAGIAAACAVLCHPVFAQDNSNAEIDAYDVIPVGDDDETEFSPLTVESRSQALPQYAADSSKGATKTDTPLIETPQSVSVITDKQIRDLGALNIQEALRYTAGVRADSYGLDSRNDTALIRGTNYVQYQDGLRGLFGNFNNVRSDVYALDSVEVIRGPSSVLYGQGTSGGMINLTTKRPKSVFASELRAEFGSYSREQFALDITGPVIDDGVLDMRLVALQRDNDTQVDFVSESRRFVAPSLTWRPATWLAWTLLGHSQRDESGTTTGFFPWEGTIQDNRNGQIPTERFASEPGFDAYDSEQDALTSMLTVHFGHNWNLSQTLRYMKNGAVYNTLFPNIYTGDPYLLDPLRRRSVLRVAYSSDATSRALTSDHRLTGRFTTGPVEHLLLAGIDISEVEARLLSAQSTPAQILLQGQFDLYDPQYGRFIAPDKIQQPKQTTKQRGYYLQNQMRLGDHLIALLGLRRDEAITQVEGSENIQDDATTKRAGLLYSFDSGWSPYLSYTEGFLPVTQVNDSGDPFEPIRSRQYEAGVKFQPSTAPVLLTLAVFDINEENRLAPGENPTVQVQLGEANIEGLEFEAMVSWPQVMDVILAYTKLDGGSDGGPNSEDTNRNRPLPAVAEEVASAWLRLQFGFAGLPGLSIGAGLRYTGAIPDESQTVTTPSYTLLDAMIAYDTAHWRLAINGSNLEDKTVISACLERGDCFYGARRSVVGSLTINF